MRIRVAIGGTDLSSAVDVNSVTVRQNSNEAISTAELRLFEAGGGARFDVAHYDQADRYAWRIDEWQQVIIWDQDTGTTYFGGFVVMIDYTVSQPHVWDNLRCSGFGILTERRIVTRTWPDGTPDITILADALAAVPELHVKSFTALASNLGEFVAQDMRVREIFDSVCRLTGGEWFVDYDGGVNYYAEGSIAAPFILSDRPDQATNRRPYALEVYRRDSADLANSITVLGQVTPTGEINVTRQNTASINKYTLLAATVVNRDIVDTARATKRADQELARRAFPLPTVSLFVLYPGLARGQTIRVEAFKVNFAESLIIRSLTLTIVAPDRARPNGHILKWSAEMGAKQTDVARQVATAPAPREKRDDAAIPIAHLPPGLEAIRTLDALPSLPAPGIPTRAIALVGGVFYRRDGNEWRSV